MAKRVSVQITADSSGFDATVAGMAGKTKRSADQIKASAASAVGSVKELSEASGRLAKAQANVADAAGAVRLAEARLQQVRGRARSTALQNATAEEALAKAQRTSLLAQRDLTAAQELHGKGIAKRLGSAEVQVAARSVALAGASVGIGVGLAVKASAQFEQAMSGVASTGGEAKASLEQLRSAAIDAGAKTKFSALEAAEGEEELLKAGLSTSQVLGGGLAGALNLAAAGNQTVAQSAEAAASAINQFGLQGSDATHVADRFVQVAGVAQGETSDVADAFRNGAVAAKTYGVSLDDASTVLALFAKNGITGAQAGTLMRSSLTNLYAPTGQAAKALKDLGISAYDSTGRAKTITQVADDLNQKLAGLDDAARNNALARIFGKETLQGGALLAQAGATGLGNIRKELDGFGTAGDIAATKMDNLAGDVENLRGSLDTLLIKGGSGANDFLRGIAQDATSAINALGDTPPAFQRGALGIATFGSAALLTGAGLIKTVGVVNDLRGSLAALGPAGSKASGVIGGVGKAAAVATVAYGVAAVAAHLVKDQNDSLVSSTAAATDQFVKLASGAHATGASLDKFFESANGKGVYDGGNIGGSVKSIADGFDRVFSPSFNQKFADMSENLFGLSSGSEQAKKSFAEMDASLSSLDFATAAKGFSQVQNAALHQGVSMDQLLTLFPQYEGALQAQAKALGVTTLSAQEYAGWMGGNVPAAVQRAAEAQPKLAQQFGIQTAATDRTVLGLQGYANALATLAAPAKLSQADSQALAQSLFTVSDASIAASNAQISYQQAVSEASKGNKGAGISADSAEGAQNLALLNQQATAYHQVATGMVAAGRSAKVVGSATAEARDDFITNATAMGVSSGKARELADKYGLIPRKVRTEIEAKVNENAQQSLTQLKALDGSVITPEVQTLINQGDYKGALAKVKELQKKRKTEIEAEAKTKGSERDLNRTANKKRKATIDSAAKTASSNNSLNKTASKKRTATINARANTSAAESALARLTRARTVSVKVKETGRIGADIATGGLITPGGVAFRAPIRRSYGGPVWGAGTATSDSIPAMLSNGEFVIRAKSVRTIGPERLSYMNREGAVPAFGTGGSISGLLGGHRGSVKGFAEGGLAAKTGRFEIADIYALLRAFAQPIAEINKAAADVKREQAKIAKPLAAKEKAEKRYERAKDKQEDLRDRVAKLTKEAAATKGVTKADRDLKKARRELSKANNEVSKSSREKTKAEAAYKDVSSDLEEATTRLTDAQKSLADSARNVSDSFSDQYRSSSTDAQDWIDLMTTGAGDLKAFNEQIIKLRKTGLSETLVQQIVQMGQVAGGEVANQILAGGAGLVGALNTANNNLQNAADDLGYTSASGSGSRVRGYATGGLLSGPGTGTSDSLNIRASTGEYVVNAMSTAANRSVLDAINYGRGVTTPHRFTSGYASGGYVRREPMIDHTVVRSALAGMRIEGALQVHNDRGYLEGVVVSVMDRETKSALTAF